MRSLLRTGASLLAGGILAAIATYLLLQPGEVRHRVIPVEKGILYRAGQLDPDDLALEIQRRGIRTVVNLGSRTNWDVEVCRQTGARYVDLPVGDVWCLAGVKAPNQDTAPEAPFDLAPLWKIIEDPSARPVLIHCWGGKHRTGVVAALYRIRYQGWSAADAIAEMDLYGFDSHKPKFQDVVAYLHRYRPGSELLAQENPPSERVEPRR
jgi:protein tyrosine/serine phosphatase